MKKRILSVVLALTMVMGILTGCGAGSDGSASGSTGGFGTKEITVSEMLNSIIEEKGEVEIYEFNPNSKILKNEYAGNLMAYLDDKGSGTMSFKAYYYDGETLKGCIRNDGKKEYIKNFLVNPSEFYEGTEIRKNPNFKGIKLVTDKNGDFLYESLGGAKFGAFERVDFNGDSYMLFTTYTFGNEDSKDFAGQLKDMVCIIIKDTDYTKDKTIVFDAIGTNGIESEVEDLMYDVKTYDKNWTPNK